MATTSPITLQSSTTQTSNGASSTPVDLAIGTTAQQAIGGLGLATTVRLTLAITAATGTTPSLAVDVETSDDQATWTTLGSFTAAAAIGVQKNVVFVGAQRYVRLRWTITGTTPSFTFAVAGVSVLVYAAPADLAFYGASAAVLSQLTSAEMDRFLTGASDEASGELQNHHQLPLLRWGDDLRRYVSSIAIWTIMSSKIGFNPENGTDVAFKMNYDSAKSALKRVGIGEIELADVIDSSDTSVPEDDGGAQIFSDAPRGWSR